MRQLAVAWVAALTVAVACAPPEVSPELRAQVSPAPGESAAAPTPTPTPEAAATPVPAPAAQTPQRRTDAGWVTVRGERFDRAWNGHLDHGDELSDVLWEVPLTGIPIGRPLVDGVGTTYVATIDPPTLVTVAPDGAVETSPLPDGGIAPVAVRGDTLVLTASGMTAAFDTTTGEVLWSVPHGVDSGREGRFAYDRSVAYVAGHDHVAAVALDLGEVLWVADLDTSRTVSGIAGVCVIDDVVCVAKGDKLFGLDSADGEVLWQLRSDLDLAGTAVAGQSLGVPTATDSAIVASGEESGRVGIEPDDGEVTWDSTASAASGSASDICSFVQTGTTVVAWSGPSEFWRRSLAGETLFGPTVATVHHVFAASVVPSDRHDYAHDTVVEAFHMDTGEPAGSVFFEGAVSHPGLGPGPDFVAAVVSIADTAQEVPRHRLVAFS